MVVALRKAEEPLKKGRKGGKLAQALDQTLRMLRDQPREPLRLGKGAGMPAKTDQPRQPENGEVFGLGDANFLCSIKAARFQRILF